EEKQVIGCYSKKANLGGRLVCGTVVEYRSQSLKISRLFSSFLPTPDAPSNTIGRISEALGEINDTDSYNAYSHCYKFHAAQCWLHFIQKNTKPSSSAKRVSTLVALIYFIRCTKLLSNKPPFH
ncbi:hypothetical protein Tcan_00670, partial [Toxocara canis]